MHELLPSRVAPTLPHDRQGFVKPFMEPAFDAKSVGLIYLAVDPAAEPLWEDARFGPFAEKIGIQAPYLRTN